LTTELVYLVCLYLVSIHQRAKPLLNSAALLARLLLIYRPRRDGRPSWPSWLTHSGRLTHKVVTRQPWIRRRSGKVRRLQTDILTTEPRRQPNVIKQQEPKRTVLSNSQSSHKWLKSARIHIMVIIIIIIIIIIILSLNVHRFNSVLIHESFVSELNIDWTIFLLFVVVMICRQCFLVDSNNFCSSS